MSTDELRRLRARYREWAKGTGQPRSPWARRGGAKDASGHAPGVETAETGRDAATGHLGAAEGAVEKRHLARAGVEGRGKGISLAGRRKQSAPPPGQNEHTR